MQHKGASGDGDDHKNTTKLPVDSFAGHYTLTAVSSENEMDRGRYWLLPLHAHWHFDMISGHMPEQSDLRSSPWTIPGQMLLLLLPNFNLSLLCVAFLAWLHWRGLCLWFVMTDRSVSPPAFHLSSKDCGEVVPISIWDTNFCQNGAWQV